MANGVIIPCEVEDKQNITSTTCTVLVQNCIRRGNIVVFNCIVTIASGVGGSTEIIKLPWKSKGRNDFIAMTSDGSVGGLYLADNSDSVTANMGTGTFTGGNYYIYGSYVTE